MSYKRHEENKRKIGQECSSMQQADYQCHRPTPWMQESVSMNARKCVHECKKVCPWMQESVSMNARKCVHECKKVCPWMQESVFMHKSPTPVRHSRMNQARSEEEEKRDRKDRGQEADGKKGSPTKQKHIWGTKTRPTIGTELEYYRCLIWFDEFHTIEKIYIRK